VLGLGLTVVLLSATPKVSVGPPPPLIVMIRTDGPAPFLKTQSRLHEELTLLLDSFIVLNTPIAVPDFPKKPLADQLAAVLPVAKQNDAAAVVWLSEPLPGQLMLHLVAQGTGRTLVRTLEFDRRSRNESALALMPRELLGTAFLYEPVQTVPPQLRAVVKATRATMSNAADVAPPPVVEQPIAPPAPMPPPRVKRLRLVALGLIDGGLVDSLGQSLQFGGGLTALFRFDNRLALGLSLAASGQRALVQPGLAVSSVSVPVMVLVSRSYPVGELTVWPRVGLGPEFTVTQSRQSVPDSLGTTTGAALVGLDLGAGGGPLTVTVRVDLIGRLARAQLLDLPAGDPFWRQPLLSLHAGIGIAWEGL
jgi:hypothetical protein